MDDNIPSEIKMKVGESTDIKLKGLATAGYEWTYTSDDKNNLIDVHKDFKLEEKLTQKNMAQVPMKFLPSPQKKLVL